MLHGILVGNLSMWYFTLAPALASNHRVIMVDLRGHGMSEKVLQGFDLATMARDLSCVVEELELGPISLVGHSYGGLIALRYAIDHPSGVDRVAVVDAPFPPADAEEIRAFLDQPVEKMVGALPILLRRSLRTRHRTASRFQQSVEYLATRTTLLADLRAEGTFSREELSRYPGPVLCVYGEASGCREGGRRLAGLLPKGRFALLPGGHFLPVESTAALADCLKGLFNG
jgi:pimeloyl-ACP methyl ester carboxylesterase